MDITECTEVYSNLLQVLIMSLLISTGIRRVLLSYKVREYHSIFLPLHQKEQVECVNKINTPSELKIRCSYPNCCGVWIIRTPEKCLVRESSIPCYQPKVCQGLFWQYNYINNWVMVPGTVSWHFMIYCSWQTSNVMSLFPLFWSPFTSPFFSFLPSWHECWSTLRKIDREILVCLCGGSGVVSPSS